MANSSSPVGIDPKIENEITSIMEGMSLRHKVGQVIQGDIGSLTPEDLKVYPLGSVLNGGNSAPNGDNRSPASDWIKLADEFYEASKMLMVRVYLSFLYCGALMQSMVITMSRELQFFLII